MKKIKSYDHFLNENPDTMKILYNKELNFPPTGFPLYLNFQSPDARAFGYLEGKMVVGPYSYTHPDLLGIHFKSRKFKDNDVPDYFKYAGRMWENYMILSFWNFPKTKEEMKKVIDDLEIEYNKVREQEGLKPVKIWDDTHWKIEIVKTKNNEIKTDTEYHWENQHSEVIPLQSYSTSEDVEELIKKFHLMNWEEKQRRKESGEISFPGFGSNRTGWEGKRPLPYRQAIYQEKIITNYQDFLK